MMNRMSFSETVFLFFLALIIFGPKKLPEIARLVGKYMNEFRRASNEFKSQIEQEVRHLEIADMKRTILEPSPTPTGTASRTLTAANEPESQAKSDEASPAIPVSTDVAPEDEPLFAALGKAESPAQEPLPAGGVIESSTSQGSHA